eukprot:Cvel_21968.t1-p1 / transcript=Cvel_21968.t1 / gene=Cvel_21968 / organism=Chromera_velia_CCMP2878 / gene_product=hypothetical protein / transcript_product=hypothetical protein / location=Cvel_scaffold2112:543-3602(-) / protein_length=360 / sequence_SO=supercontig / SO=protein_coding / is_pseudo=false
MIGIRKVVCPLFLLVLASNSYAGVAADTRALRELTEQKEKAESLRPPQRAQARSRRLQSDHPDARILFPPAYPTQPQVEVLHRISSSISDDSSRDGLPAAYGFSNLNICSIDIGRPSLPDSVKGLFTEESFLPDNNTFDGLSEYFGGSLDKLIEGIPSNPFLVNLNLSFDEANIDLVESFEVTREVEDQSEIKTRVWDGIGLYNVQIPPVEVSSADFAPELNIRRQALLIQARSLVDDPDSLDGLTEEELEEIIIQGGQKPLQAPTLDLQLANLSGYASEVRSSADPSGTTAIGEALTLRCDTQKEAEDVYTFWALSVLLEVVELLCQTAPELPDSGVNIVCLVVQPLPKLLFTWNNADC